MTENQSSEIIGGVVHDLYNDLAFNRFKSSPVRVIRKVISPTLGIITAEILISVSLLNQYTNIPAVSKYAIEEAIAAPTMEYTGINRISRIIVIMIVMIDV